jgi:hypothetical protein
MFRKQNIFPKRLNHTFKPIHVAEFKSPFINAQNYNTEN